MRRRKKERITTTPRSLRFQQLESRQLLAADALMADITGMWVTVGDREYYTSDQASVTVDMYQGESLQITGIEYRMADTATPADGVIAFESYVRREHGATTIGSYDYTDGRFGDPLAEQISGGHVASHPGLDSGWQLDVIDNRVALIAIRYFGDESVVEDRMYININVAPSVESPTLNESLAPITGDWQITENEISGDSLNEAAGLTVIDTGTATSQRFEVGVKAKTVQDHTFANGFVVVDYQNQNDFVYAGLRLTDNQWVIGHFDGSFNDLATLEQDIEPRQIYDLRIAVDGSHIALAADGILRVSHDFARPLEQGAIGLANQFAYTHFTEFHVFDNSATLAPSPQQAHEQASIAAEEALQASDAANAAATQAAQVSQAADLAARSLETASTDADTALANASAAQADAVQAVTDTEQLIEQATTTIESATLDQQAAAASIAELNVTLADAEQTAGPLTEENAAAQQAVNDLAEQHIVAQQVADEAVSASETAAAAAISARQASDDAAAVYADSKGAPKSIRKALQKAAREADNLADDAERVADDAANAAADALTALQAISDQLAAAQQVAEQTAAAATEAQSVVDAIMQSIDIATDTLNAATQSIQDAEVSLTAAQQQLPQLQTQVTIMSEEVSQASAAAAVASEEATSARAVADLAASEADAATVESVRLAGEVEIANQMLADAELALQDALAAEQAAVEQGEVQRVYSVNFNNQDDGAFQTIAGTSHVLAGQLHLAPERQPLAVSVLESAALPERTATRMYATVRADALPGHDQNGFIVFDYQSNEDFKYAGVRADSDQWVVGEVVAGQHLDVAVLDEVIGEGPAQELQVWIEEHTVTLLVEGNQKIQHTFTESIHDGDLGVASQNARSRFDQVAVMQLYGGAGDAGLDDAAPDPAANDAAISELF